MTLSYLPFQEFSSAFLTACLRWRLRDGECTLAFLREQMRGNTARWCLYFCYVFFSRQPQRLSLVSWSLDNAKATAHGASDYQNKRTQQVTDRMSELLENASRRSSLGIAGNNLPSESPSHHTSHVDKDPSAVERRYECELSQMNRYYYKETYDIAKDESSYPHHVVVLRKQRLLKECKALKPLKAEINIRPHVAWFTVNVLEAIVLGALLNASPFDSAGPGGKYRIMSAVALFFAFVAMKMITLS